MIGINDMLENPRYRYSQLFRNLQNTSQKNYMYILLPAKLHNKLFITPLESYFLIF